VGQGDDEFAAVDLHADQVGCFAGAVVIDKDAELLRLLQVGGDVGLDGIRLVCGSLRSSWMSIPALLNQVVATAVMEAERCRADLDRGRRAALEIKVTERMLSPE
jgi:hypothetical protein